MSASIGSSAGILLGGPADLTDPLGERLKSQDWGTCIGDRQRVRKELAGGPRHMGDPKRRDGRHRPWFLVRVGSRHTGGRRPKAFGDWHARAARRNDHNPLPDPTTTIDRD